MTTKQRLDEIRRRLAKDESLFEAWAAALLAAP